MLSRIAWAVAIVAASAFNTTVFAGTWVLETHWKCTEGKQDPSLEYYDTKAKVLERLEQHRKDHAEGGLLFYAPCKPVQFRYWFETDLNGTVSRTGMETVEVNPPAATIPKSKASEGQDGPKGNRKWVMWLEQFKEGQWALVPDRRFEYLESDGVTETAWQEKLERYETAVESENKKNIDQETRWQQNGLAVKPVRYRVRWSETGIAKSESQTANVLEGTVWVYEDQPDGVALNSGKRHRIEYLFMKNGEFRYYDIYSDGVFAQNYAGKWRNNSDGSVYVTYSTRKESHSFTLSVKADRLMFQGPGSSALVKSRRSWEN